MTFYKIFGFLLETARSSIIRIQFKLVTKETQKLVATSHIIRLNKHQSGICAPLYKSRYFKHCTFNQPFEIKHRIHVILESEDHKTIPAQEEIQSQIVIN